MKPRIGNIYKLCTKCHEYGTKSKDGVCSQCKPYYKGSHRRRETSHCKDCGRETQCRGLLCGACASTRKVEKVTLVSGGTLREDRIYDTKTNCTHEFRFHYTDSRAHGPCASCRICSQDLVLTEGQWRVREIAKPAPTGRRKYFKGKLVSSSNAKTE